MSAYDFVNGLVYAIGVGVLLSTAVLFVCFLGGLAMNLAWKRIRQAYAMAYLQAAIKHYARDTGKRPPADDDE